MDPQVQQALKKINKANRRVIAAMGMLMLASLNATKAMQKLNEEVQRNGNWQAASQEEADEAVEEAVADMVATYSSQVN